ncbi:MULTISPECIES: hypothetical protein [Virgibacillus]|uniref:Uncharacterized protein n=2 Tax=Virgibacillus TaxID=84406 RepID=A0A024Q7N2_9BACI|nr:MULTISPECIES: hypothetical protein [Virgibacillus]EQB37956.1 hypothetical protein M948_05145 [Virgibacillus sp. CM-4]GGJ72954.1 hypothetical protein GCM10007111_38240 [Virgibacillus kapii]CDQ38528.1 hypothetical protein BN990_00798 [Virgibacillus massiliensis]
MIRNISISASKYLDDIINRLHLNGEFNLQELKRRPKRKLKNSIALLDLQAHGTMEALTRISGYDTK